ncbi:anti-sigma factor [Cellulomonas edaphi]|uniref:Anti-sigma factor n=1 Tax=Cellulomonas edaphi TaxID=3053468 RepID=A0ABT7S2Z5_9CELL|nr:anti-sigma factor [Cellulomons edaphi]MDM7829993.1 anti-sigma factor [Cellulomons edaphi]
MPLDEFHVDEDVLALLALGEEAGTTADRAHVQQCELCADEIAVLADVVAVARAGDAELVSPGPQVWERVAAELDLAPASGSGTAAPERAVEAAPEHSAEAAPERSVQPLPDEAPDVVVPLAPRRAGGRRPRAWAWAAAAAVVGIIVGGAGAAWALTQGDRVKSVVATATLEPLPGWDADGSATVETRRDGTRVLVVDVNEQTAPAGFREVWLLRPDVSGLVAVGTLEGASGRFELPAGLDLSEFSVVDVSQEQFDGDPAHSGDSIVRGAQRAGARRPPRPARPEARCLEPARQACASGLCLRPAGARAGRRGARRPRGASCWCAGC